MSITLQQFASGETGYIAKMNANSSTIEAAINALIDAVGSAGGSSSSTFTIGAFLQGLFGGASGLIGEGSYKPTVASADTLSVAAGTCYKAVAELSVRSITPVVISFAGLPAATYYIVPDSIGTPGRSTSSTDAVYSVVWTGTAFGAITRLVKVLYTAEEEDNALTSTVFGTTHTSLDGRLEVVEAMAAAVDDVIPSLKIRKVGITIDGGGAVIEAGVKGAIQVDFAGGIVGWSIIADQPGQIEIDVAVARESPTAVPPAAPPIPDPVTDKITASAPIALDDPSGSQSAAAGAAEVSTWDTAIEQYDVIQFNVVSASTITRVTLYISIEES